MNLTTDIFTYDVEKTNLLSEKECGKYFTEFYKKKKNTYHFFALSASII